MWRQLAVVVTLISACTPVADDETARLEQPLPGVDTSLVLTNSVQGVAFGAHLGDSLDACRGAGGYLAGAPGMDGLYASPLGSFFTVPLVAANVAVGGSVLCDRTQSLGLLGGTNGLYRFFVDGGSELVFTTSGVSAIAGGPVNTPPLFSATSPDGGMALYRLQIAAGVPVAEFLASNDSPTWGQALSMGPLGDRALVGDPNRSRAIVYKQLADGGFEHNLTLDGGDVMGEFGKVVLMADITPDVGAELIIGSPSSGRVSVYSGNRLRYVLEGAQFMNGGAMVNPVEFGSALAVEPTLASRPIAALWVGEPGTNRVYRCLGSECVPFSSTMYKGRFGATLAFDGRKLVVGAPDYTGINVYAGAVFEFEFDAGTLDGEPMSCQPGDSCVTNQSCRIGRCVGGVYCVANQPSACSVGERCVNGQCMVSVPDGGVDAGSPDAGEPDAGVVDAGGPDAGGEDAGSPDAGREDAGSPDAGRDDAGVVDAGTLDGGAMPDDSLVVYRAGCSSAPGTLWVILAALAWRRRRRS